MTAQVHLAASVAFQQPVKRTDVCPHCGKATVMHCFISQGHWLETHHCKDHGDVVPTRSHTPRRTHP